MKKSTYAPLIAILISIGLAAVVAAAVSTQSATYAGWSIFAICAILSFAINWVAYVPANIAQTEHYYDLTGSLTYLSVIACAVVLTPSLDLRAKIVAAMVVIWAVRLGTFLFRRIKRDGQDDRFDQIKIHPLRFLMTWTLQALWVVLTAACALAIITSENRVELGTIGFIGIAVWVAGFAIEVIADQQKSTFKLNPSNQGRFIQSGLWSWSRHPNYFGEILLWFGVAIIALPVLTGWALLALISPVFVYALIVYVSGVNKLEDKADAKWGDNADYQSYKARTSLLVPRPPAAAD